MKRNAQAITIAVLVAVAAAVLGRQWGWSPSRPPAGRTPQDAVYSMLDAAREGDVGAYLDSYSGRLRAELEQGVREQGKRQFGEYLRTANAAIKGIAINEPEPMPEGRVKARVEYVYQDRNEVQWMYLEQVDGRWRIGRVEAAQRIPTVVPYGTPVE